MLMTCLGDPAYEPEGDSVMPFAVEEPSSFNEVGLEVTTDPSPSDGCPHPPPPSEEPSPVKRYRALHDQFMSGCGNHVLTYNPCEEHHEEHYEEHHEEDHEQPLQNHGCADGVDPLFTTPDRRPSKIDIALDSHGKALVDYSIHSPAKYVPLPERDAELVDAKSDSEVEIISDETSQDPLRKAIEERIMHLELIHRLRHIERKAAYSMMKLGLLFHRVNGR